MRALCKFMQIPQCDHLLVYGKERKQICDILFIRVIALAADATLASKIILGSIT